MYKVITENPIAIDSPDHINPFGTRLDFNTSIPLIVELEEFFELEDTEQFSLLDLGCAMGKWVEDVQSRGHIGVGIEGSSANKDQSPFWRREGGRSVFTCDLAKPFQILTDNDEDALYAFDIITAWDVLEHLTIDGLHVLFHHIDRYLSRHEEAKFMGTIATIGHIHPEDNVELHQTIRGESAWLDHLSDYFEIMPYPFRNNVRPDTVDAGSSFLFCCRSKRG